MRSEQPRPSRRSLPRLLALAVALTGTISAVTPGSPAAATPAPEDPGLGCGSAEITHTLDTGSAWRMCVRNENVKGLVLEQIQFRPAPGPSMPTEWLPVVDSLYLAQLNVPYDGGTIGFNDLTGFGFGGYNMLRQNEKLCPGQTMDVEQSFIFGYDLIERTIPGICLDEVSTGLGWASHESNDARSDSYVQQARALEISSMTKISWYEYQQKITLSDQGTITVGLGATGDLAPVDLLFTTDPSTGWPINPADGDPTRHAQSHWHNAIYRVDFGIDSGEQQVEQWDYSRPDPGLPARIEGTGTIRTQAFHAPDDVDPQTWWRVLNPASLNADGHPQSYEIVNDAIQDPWDALTRPKVSFTNNHPCQEYASDNLNIGCPNLSVPDYVAAETAPLTDPVAWVNVGFHHIVRDEDQSPMPAHWQQFSLVPRDLVAQQPTVPIERSCVNGGPSLEEGSCAAINTVPPRVTTQSTSPDVGTTLSSDRGTWRVARAALTITRQWLRDGQPIPGATGVQHILTTADRGHRIRVRVDATGVGIIPGTALSNEVLIPRAPNPSASPSPTQPPRRVSPTLSLVLPAKGQPRLRVRAKGKAGTVTGTVVVRGPGGWTSTRKLNKGTVVVRVPRSLAAKRARVVVRYRGDASYLPVQRRIRLR
jgi:primary-amine oxidase